MLWCLWTATETFFWDSNAYHSCSFQTTRWPHIPAEPNTITVFILVDKVLISRHLPFSELDAKPVHVASMRNDTIAPRFFSVGLNREVDPSWRKGWPNGFASRKVKPNNHGDIMVEDLILATYNHTNSDGLSPPNGALVNLFWTCLALSSEHLAGACPKLNLLC